MILDMPDPAVQDRVQLARRIYDFGLTPEDLGPRQYGRAAAAAPRAALMIGWPDGLAPTPTELPIEPATDEPLPKADYLVVTWTVAELQGLADVLTPGVNPRTRWYRYDHRFDEYLANIRNGAPSRLASRLGSWYPTRIGNRSVICFKSELHLNQDGVRTGPGTATLPVADLFRQLIAEVQPKMVLTVGTAGATMDDHALGDVVITRGAQFRLSQEFANEPFAKQAYKSDQSIPKKHVETANRLLTKFAPNLTEPDWGPPTMAYPFPGPLLSGVRNKPALRIDGRDFPKFHPILSTDFFEFGTSGNNLGELGCGIEMGDAALGMVCEELGSNAPRWLVVRNLSDPLINADLPTDPVDMQAHWSVWYYETYGYWTSVNSAIATWAMIAR
jgi:nucleoside phosphorylase